MPTSLAATASAAILFSQKSKSGRLVARRAVGRKLVITAEDAKDWRLNLPKAADNVAAA